MIGLCKDCKYWNKEEYWNSGKCIDIDLDTFNDIFGKEEGERLFRHFRFDCNHDFIKFKTYLLNNQTNDIFAHIVKIKL